MTAREIGDVIERVIGHATPEATADTYLTATGGEQAEPPQTPT